MTTRSHRRRDGSTSGFTLIEVSIALVIIGVLAAVTFPNVTRYQQNMRGRAAARSVADAFNVARAQAIRTGSNHVVFFSYDGGTDAAGNDLRDGNGELVPILVLNDGAPGSANQNCEIDAGEERITFEARDGVGWGSNAAPASEEAPNDEAVSSIPATGGSFFAPDGTTPVTWVQFRPDGVPVAVDGACSAGQVGTGGGTIYLWTEFRDYAVTLTPLGGVRVHTWDAGRGAWTS